MNHIPKYIWAIVGGFIGADNAVRHGHYILSVSLENLTSQIHWDETLNYSINVFLGGLITLWLKWVVSRLSERFNKGKEDRNES